MWETGPSGPVEMERTPVPTDPGVSGVHRTGPGDRRHDTAGVKDLGANPSDTRITRTTSLSTNGLPSLLYIYAALRDDFAKLTQKQKGSRLFYRRLVLALRLLRARGNSRGSFPSRLTPVVLAKTAESKSRRSGGSYGPRVGSRDW